MRIAKYISNAGICSRRNAEKLILEGKVIVNNKICNKPNINVKLDDKILVNNKIVSINKFSYSSQRFFWISTNIF